MNLDEKILTHLQLRLGDGWQLYPSLRTVLVYEEFIDPISMWSIHISVVFASIHIIPYAFSGNIKTFEKNGINWEDGSIRREIDLADPGSIEEAVDEAKSLLKLLKENAA